MSFRLDEGVDAEQYNWVQPLEPEPGLWQWMSGYTCMGLFILSTMIVLSVIRWTCRKYQPCKQKQKQKVKVKVDSDSEEEEDPTELAATTKRLDALLNRGRVSTGGGDIPLSHM